MMAAIAGCSGASGPSLSERPELPITESLPSHAADDADPTGARSEPLPHGSRDGGKDSEARPSDPIDQSRPTPASNGCPGANDGVCCGRVVCIGCETSESGDCRECEKACAPGEICCKRGGPPRCTRVAASCS
jgi:hypothetical protein